MDKARIVLEYDIRTGSLQYNFPPAPPVMILGMLEQAKGIILAQSMTEPGKKPSLIELPPGAHLDQRAASDGILRKS